MIRKKHKTKKFRLRKGGLNGSKGESNKFNSLRNREDRIHRVTVTYVISSYHIYASCFSAML